MSKILSICRSMRGLIIYYICGIFNEIVTERIKLNCKNKNFTLFRPKCKIISFSKIKQKIKTDGYIYIYIYI